MTFTESTASTERPKLTLSLDTGSSGDKGIGGTMGRETSQMIGLANQAP